MKVIFKLLMAISIIICFAACKSAHSSTASQSSQSSIDSNTKNGDITNKYWKLIEIYGNPVVVSDKTPTEPHLILKEDNRYSGSGGCNNIGGTFELSNVNRIKFSNGISTQMACLDMNIETKLLEVLRKADSYTLSADGNTLSLNRARMAPLARFQVVYLK